MSLIKCRCGVYTSNGLFCTNCSKDSSIESLYYSPEDTEDTEDDEVLEELEGLTILDEIEGEDKDDKDD